LVRSRPDGRSRRLHSRYGRRRYFGPKRRRACRHIGAARSRSEDLQPHQIVRGRDGSDVAQNSGSAASRPVSTCVLPVRQSSGRPWAGGGQDGIAHKPDTGPARAGRREVCFSGRCSPPGSFFLVTARRGRASLNHISCAAGRLRDRAVFPKSHYYGPSGGAPATQRMPRRPFNPRLPDTVLLFKRQRMRASATPVTALIKSPRRRTQPAVRFPRGRLEVAVCVPLTMHLFMDHGWRGAVGGHVGDAPTVSATGIPTRQAYLDSSGCG